MLKPSKNFRIWKETKRAMATIVDPVQRNIYKSAMIQAQLISELPPVREKSDKK
jgi:hypothetical protein